MIWPEAGLDKLSGTLSLAGAKQKQLNYQLWIQFVKHSTANLAIFLNIKVRILPDTLTLIFTYPGLA
jgi:hypothetical protein